MLKYGVCFEEKEGAVAFSFPDLPDLTKIMNNGDDLHKAAEQALTDYLVCSIKNKKTIPAPVTACENFVLPSPIAGFVAWLKIERNIHGLKKLEVAKLIGVQPQRYGLIENLNSNPTLNTILKLKRIFNDFELCI